MARTMRGGNRLFGGETALVYLLLSSSGFWKPPESAHQTHMHPHAHVNSQSRRSLRYTCAQTLHQIFCLGEYVWGKEKVALLFLFSFSPLFLGSLFLRVPLSFSFFPSPSLAELQRERVHQGKEEEKEREATAGSGQASSKGGAAISITVPFGNRDTSISNKTAKPRQIALTWGCNLSTPPTPHPRPAPPLNFS